MMTRFMSVCVAAGLALAHGAPAAAQPAEVPPAPLPAAVTSVGPATTAVPQRYRIESRNVGKPFFVDVIRIDRPFPPATEKLAVVFVPDGNVLTSLVPAIAHLGSFESLPSMIVVGISYDFGAADPQEAAFQGFARRLTDFTPTADEPGEIAMASLAAQQLFGMEGWPDDVPFGRADAFLAFIDEELKPFLAARYPAADLEDSALVGHSLGGLFAMHVLLTSPDSFDRYVALDPSPWGDVLMREVESLGDVSARLFAGASGVLPPGLPPGIRTPVETLGQLEARLRTRDRPGLEYTFKIFPEETHNSLPPAGIMAGLRAVFDPPPPLVPLPPAGQAGDSR